VARLFGVHSATISLLIQSGADSWAIVGISRAQTSANIVKNVEMRMTFASGERAEQLRAAGAPR
jgi:hypothetical protein